MINPEDKYLQPVVNLDKLGESIAAMLLSKPEKLYSLDWYVRTAEEWTRCAIAASILEQVIAAGIPPDEIIGAMAWISHKWDSNGSIAVHLNKASHELGDLLRNKAQSDTGN